MLVRRGSRSCFKQRQLRSRCWERDFRSFHQKPNGLAPTLLESSFSQHFLDLQSTKAIRFKKTVDLLIGSQRLSASLWETESLPKVPSLEYKVQIKQRCLGQHGFDNPKGESFIVKKLVPYGGFRLSKLCLDLPISTQTQPIRTTTENVPGIGFGITPSEIACHSRSNNHVLYIAHSLQTAPYGNPLFRMRRIWLREGYKRKHGEIIYRSAGRETILQKARRNPRAEKFLSLHKIRANVFSGSGHPRLNVHQDTLLKTPDQRSKSMSVSAAMCLSSYSTENLLINRHRSLGQIRAQPLVRLLARPSTAGNSLLGYEARRFASTFVAHESKSSHTDHSVGLSTETQSNQIARHDIRKHLRQWKAAEDTATKTVSSHHDSSVPSSRKTMNAISQSGQSDETYVNLQFDGHLDASVDLHTASSENIVDAMMPHIVLSPGDLVDVKTNKNSMIAIVIGQDSGMVYIYTERGTWHEVHSKFIQFSVPNMISSHDVSHLSCYLEAAMKVSEGEKLHGRTMPIVPRNAGSALVAKMSHFLRASDAVFREYADRITRAYEILSQDDPHGYTSVTLEDAARRLFEKQSSSELTAPMLLTVHRALQRKQNITQSKANHRINPVFRLSPRAAVSTFEMVGKWVREFQEDKMRNFTEPPIYVKNTRHSDQGNHLSRFVVKARRIILFNRQIRPLSPVGTVGLSQPRCKQKEPGLTESDAFEQCQEAFDEDEQHIIGFLAAWSLSQQFNGASVFESLGSAILRASDMYHDIPLDEYTACTMLHEMGIVKPWERAALFDSRLQLPSEDSDDPMTVLLNEAHRSLSELPFTDAMSQHRKSWGDSRVLCIDGQGAQEIDDGISLEPVDGDTNMCWVHVHIANPSAFLSKDSPMARYARHTCTSVYFPDGKYPMLEADLSKKRFSLANGRPCITFSAKVSMEGDVMEKTITHGILNNVHQIPWHHAAQVLRNRNNQAMEQDQISVLKVGLDSPGLGSHITSSKSSGNAATLDDADIDILKSLQKVSKALQRKRQRYAGYTGLSQTDFQQAWAKRPTVNVSLPLSSPSSPEGEGGKLPTIHTQGSRHLVGDPVISVHQLSQDVSEVTGMVANFMILAGQICALWCSERNIPILYRGVVHNPNLLQEKEVFRNEALDFPDRKDPASWNYWKSNMFHGVAHCSATPLEHGNLGLPVYCKSTSPLRRYADLFTHWQIEAAIRRESSTGKSLIGTNSGIFDDQTVLPFSHSEVEGIARTVSTRERQITIESRDANSHWILQALYRAFYFQEAVLPARFEILVTGSRAGLSKTLGSWLAWQLPCRLSPTAASEQEAGFREGDIWEASLARVHPLRGELEFDPVRLIQRTEGST